MYDRIIQTNTPEQNRFTSISDFKWSMKCGGEVVFTWNGTKYCCFGNLKAPDMMKTMMYISKLMAKMDGRILKSGVRIQTKSWNTWLVTTA